MDNAEIDTLLRLARATIADITEASDGDIIRACDALIQYGDLPERDQAIDIKALIAGKAA